MSSTQTDPPRPAPRKARATSPPPAPGGKTFGGARASRASGTPPTLLPAGHVAKFASFGKTHQFHHSPVPLGSDSGPFRPTEEFDPSSRAHSCPDRARAARHRSPHRNESTVIATSDRLSHQRQRQPSLDEFSAIPSAPLREIAGQKRVAPHWTRSLSRRSHPPFDLARADRRRAQRRGVHGTANLKSVRGADRLISGSHRPGRLRSSRAGNTARVEGKNQWIKHPS